MNRIALRFGAIVFCIGLAAVPANAVADGFGAPAAQAAAKAPDLHSWRLTRHGFGRLTVGLNREQMERRTGRTLKSLGGMGGCGIWTIRGVRGLSIMTAGGRLARVDVSGHSWRTSTGVRVGDSEDDVRSRYPGIRSEKHPYDPDGEYLIVPGRHRRVVFETDGQDRVTSFRGGRLPQVMYVEGCS